MSATAGDDFQSATPTTGEEYSYVDEPHPISGLEGFVYLSAPPPPAPDLHRTTAADHGSDDFFLLMNLYRQGRVFGEEGDRNRVRESTLRLAGWHTIAHVEIVEMGQPSTNTIANDMYSPTYCTQMNFGSDPNAPGNGQNIEGTTIKRVPFSKGTLLPS